MWTAGRQRNTEEMWHRMRWAFAAGLCLLAAVAQAQAQAQAPAEQSVPSPLTADVEPTQPDSAPAADPPSRVVRLSLLQGDVSAEPSSVNTFSPAELNQVLTSGDRVYTDTSATAELQAGQTAVRLGGGTDLTVTAMTDAVAQFGLASGSVHVRSFAVPAGTVLELDTAEVAVTVLQPGNLRVDEDPAGHTSTVAVIAGQVQIDGPGLSQTVNAGERVRVHGSDPATTQAAYAEPLAPADADALDSFSDERDNLYANGAQTSSDFLNPETTGSADLAAYGNWSTDDDAGPVWFPVVAVGWRPYLYGHWRWVAPWGWTWVGAEPWAFAPFHYGRWRFVGGRWGWIPGVPVLRPVYAPALVAFVGGRQTSASAGPAGGTTGWFPLGPREPYAPWYHGSTRYLNRVNASNIYDPHTAQARAFYNQRAVNIFSSGPRGVGGDRSYANRDSGTVVVSQSSFAAGQSVARNQIHLPPSEMAQAPLLAHPVVSPERSTVVSGLARAVPPGTARNSFRSLGQDAGSPDSGIAERFPSRPAFLHSDTNSVAHPSFEEQRRTMDRTEPGRPLPAIESIRPDHPVGGVGPREAPRAAPGTSHPTPAPSRPAPANPRPAPAGAPK